jgi:hypothetical protein
MSFVRCFASSVRTESDGCAPFLIHCWIRSLLIYTTDGFELGLKVPTFSTKLLSRADFASVTTTRK